MLHTYSDGSVLKIITSRELIAIPIWKGQRILDKEHAAAIKSEVGSDISSLDSGYSIVNYKEENADGKLVMSSYLIDGQHRASVIRDFYSSTICEPDFNITVREKSVESESDAIQYFNKINNVKAQQWKMDPNLLINNYISALEKVFNRNKKCLLIRADTTTRPYLSSANLREALNTHKSLLKVNNSDILRFIDRVERYNMAIINKFSLELTQEGVKDMKLKERAIHVNFALAYDTNLKWLREMLI
jgi:hypothetical protein